MKGLLGIVRRWRGQDELSDEALVALARDGDEAAVRALVSRHNQRLYRVAMATGASASEAEDIVQETYGRAFTRLAGFRGDAAFSTWLTRIALNEARGRRRRRRPVALDQVNAEQLCERANVVSFPTTAAPADPESEAGREQVRRVLEHAIAELPEAFRLVFVLRDVQGLSTAETARVLSVRTETIKTRLHRARALVRRALERKLSAQFSDLFPFGGARCLRLGDRVVEQLRQENRVAGRVTPAGDASAQPS